MEASPTVAVENNSVRARPGLPYLISVVFIVLITSVIVNNLSFFVINLVLAIIFILVIQRKSIPQLKLYLVAYIIAFLFMFLVHWANETTYGTPYYIGGSDDYRFEISALKAMELNVYNPDVLVGTVLDQFHNAPFYVSFIAVIMKISSAFDGYSTYTPKMVNIYLLLLVAHFVSELLKKYARFTDKQLLWFIGILVLTPNILYVNSHVFRDMLNMFQIVFIIYAVDKLLTRNWGVSQIAIATLLPLVVYSAFYTRVNSLVFAVAGVLFLLASKFNLKYRYMFILIIPFIIFSTFLDDIRFDYFYDTYSAYQADLSSGLSNFIFNQNLFPLGAVLRFGYAFITPFPNFLALFQDPELFSIDVVSFLIYLGVVVQFLSFPFVLRRMLTIDWLTMTFLCLLLGVVLTTFTFRHVVFYYPFLVAMAISGFSKVEMSTRWLIVLASITGVFLLFFAYVQLKV